jgi:hypothetical protein
VIWRRGDGRNIIADTGHVIRHDRDIYGVDSYHAYAPVGSGTVDIAALQRIAAVFDCNQTDVDIAQRSARAKLGVFSDPEEARDHCEQDTIRRGIGVAQTRV